MSRTQKTITTLDTLWVDDDHVKTDDTRARVHDADTPLRTVAMDLFCGMDERLEALTRLVDTHSDDLCEILSTLTGMYQFSRTKNLEDYLCAISSHLPVPLTYRIDCAKSLPTELGYHQIHRMFETEADGMKALPTPMRVQTVMYLIDSEAHKEDARKWLSDITLDGSIDCLYRFRTIQGLETHFLSTVVVRRRRRRGDPPPTDDDKQAPPFDQNKRDAFLYHARWICKQFIQHTANLFTYRVLACQYLLEKCEPDDELQEMSERFLLEVAEDVALAEDLRADACDVILQYGSDAARDAGRRLLFVLGGGEQSRNNIYKNSQNVHVRAIEESVQGIIDHLSTYYPENGKVLTFTDVCDEIRKKVESDDWKHEKDAVEGALTRVAIDRAVYGHSNMALSTILTKVWTYVQNSEYREELERRLIEELVESNNKCSSGYAGRIVNTLSGFDEKMSVSISFEDQIISNLEARLNTRIRSLDDPDRVEKILDEMTIPVIEYDKRGNFLRFFREHISKIREEMYSEFCQYMDDTDYDFYFRKAIIHYEGCF